MPSSSPIRLVSWIKSVGEELERLRRVAQGWLVVVFVVCVGRGGAGMLCVFVCVYVCVCVCVYM